MRSKVSLRRPLEPLSHLIDCLCLGVITKMRVFFFIVGALAGAYTSSSSALADVEEEVSDEVNEYDYSMHILSGITITNHFVDNIINEDAKRYTIIIDSPRGNAEYAQRNTGIYFSGRAAFHSSELDDVLIPDTVWSLDGSAGVHVDRISGGPGSEIYAAFGGRFELANFWYKSSPGLWGGNNTEEGLDLPISLPPFQVASCGDGAAELSNLDYCSGNDIQAAGNGDTKTKIVRHENDNPKTSTTISADSNVVLPSTAPSSSPNIPPNFAETIPASANTFQLREDPFLQVPYDDFSMFCAPTFCAPIPTDLPTDSPVALIDDQTPLVDLTPPVVLPPSTIVPGDPTPNLGQRPIPEAPTWVMTTIGFGIMVFVFGKKKKRRNNTISIIDASEAY
jgi:hypothetical protein